MEKENKIDYNDDNDKNVVSIKNYKENNKYTFEEYHFLATSFFKVNNFFESEKLFNICLKNEKEIKFKHSIKI